MLCDILGAGDKVEVELRDTELHFFSLNANKLDESEKKMEEKFSEVKYDIPNCFVVPPELREKLKSKTNEMNQKECRAKVVFGADNTVYLLGHTKEVEELSDAVIEFILDQSSIEARVELPFPELVQLLPELLQLHNFDFSGVTFSPLTAYSRPTVVLEGSANNVAEVKNRLGLFLDSIVQDKVTIEMAGAVRFFDCHAGRESLLKVAHAHKCLIQLEEQPHISRHNLGFAKYNLQHGLQVLVCEGDITKQDADALVNAANGDLNHIGGVAAALSKAGGPQVQKESKTIVKQTGKIPTGKVVVTTGGNLKCKALLHAVGPVGGKESGRERIMLEKTVHNVLNLAEMMEFKSIAMPCISSGVFGVPIRVCSDAIVTAIKTFDSQGGRSLSKIVLIDNRVEVVRAMQEACDRLLQEKGTRRNLELPQHWESMHGQYFKKVELQHYSSEYQKVATDFLKTAKYSIHKIERVQNVFLWQAFSVCRQRIIAKNGSAELHEKFLYHGTSAESCNCIERDRFDRSYAGTHAAVYGKGVYFAVNAKYSADTYSPADVSGLKRLYVARVLVGRYTVGNSSMKAPPPRGSDPTDCFNSLVDNQQHPSMFIIFHDDQAYPEYLITFR
uniref:Poly [ADP-ribose] polymerase n=1 Tax=Kryptolebias marmoratus TaxID=37003 RepID=A0A3Q3GGE1_KRYMA